MATLANRVKMTTATTGTGTLTLGTASTSFQSFADGGISDTNVVKYLIEDGADWEIGTGTYTSSGTTLSRTVIESTNSDAELNLTGNALVSVQVVATDLQGLVDFGATFSLPTSDGTADQVLKTDGSGNLGFTTVGGGEGLVPISKTTASSDAAIDIDLTGGYNAYVVRFDTVAPASDIVNLLMRTSTDGGTTFDGGAGDYAWFYAWGVPSFSHSDSTAATAMTLAAQLGNSTNENLCGQITIYPANGSRWTLVHGLTTYVSRDPLMMGTWNAAAREDSTTVDAVRFLMSSGNIASGNFHLYGVADGA